MEEGQGAALTVESLSKRFGAVLAVDGATFRVEPGSLTCLIGPNGAGKSTLLHCVSGFLRPEAGRVLLDDEDISRWHPHRRARSGLGTVFQVMRAPNMDVLTSTMVGCHSWTRSGFLSGILRPPWQWREERRVREEAWRALGLVGLQHRASDRADALPLGQLRLLSVARVLAQRPPLLLLDEPVAGLRAAEKRQLMVVFRDLRKRGLTQILVEHDMQFVGSVADRILVLDRGRLIADGPPEQVRQDELVIEAYLGTGAVL
jgi:ABC-type branched-subunit amino acid transport system ATPase component